MTDMPPRLALVTELSMGFVCSYPECDEQPTDEITRLYCSGHAQLESHRPPGGTMTVDGSWQDGWNARRVESLTERERARMLGFMEGRASANDQTTRRVIAIGVISAACAIAGLVVGLVIAVSVR